MSGRRRKPCDFCEDWWTNQECAQNDAGQLVAEFYPDNGLFGITAFVKDDGGETHQLEISYNFEYCPLCGRKLEVW